MHLLLNTSVEANHAKNLKFSVQIETGRCTMQVGLSQDTAAALTAASGAGSFAQSPAADDRRTPAGRGRRGRGGNRVRIRI